MFRILFSTIVLCTIAWKRIIKKMFSASTAPLTRQKKVPDFQKFSLVFEIQPLQGHTYLLIQTINAECVYMTKNDLKRKVMIWTKTIFFVQLYLVCNVRNCYPQVLIKILTFWDEKSSIQLSWIEITDSYNLYPV